MIVHEAAAYSVCRAMEERDDDTGATMVNLWGAEVPPEAEPWVSTVGPYRFIPMRIAAMVALGRRDIPSPDVPAG